MKMVLALSTALLTFATSALASNVFVRSTRGNLSRAQSESVTNMVKSAVRNQSEHSLVQTSSNADFILQPSVITRGDTLVLRVEKEKNGEILSMSESSIPSLAAARTRAPSVTETALSDSSYGSAYATDDDGARDTSSATSVSASDMDQSTNGDAQNSAAGPIEVSGNGANAAAAPATRTNDSSSYRQAGADASVGELTSASPRMLSADRIGQIQLGVGPSFGINMKDDSLMYDLMAAYAVSFSDNFVGKVFGDFNLATGSSFTRFINLGVAGEYYPSRELLTFGKPYLAADLGYAFTRDGLARTGDGAAAGIGAGFKFQAAEMNWDVAANYTLLLNQVADETPSVFGIRVALGF